MKKNKLFYAIFFISGILIGSIVGWETKPVDISDCKLKPIREKGFNFIEPLLFCETEDTVNSKSMQDLKKKMGNLIEEKKKNGVLETASLYFRDYNFREWIDINEEEKYAPASLLKVPVMITYLKLNDKYPEILKQKLNYNFAKDYNAAQHFKPEKTLQKGKNYTIENLLMRMIVFSDNNALALLADYMDANDLREAYKDIDVPLPPGVAPGENGSKMNPDFLTVRDYSYFFRLLFNSTYLKREMSEKALKWLSETNFTDGIKAGIPAGISIAEKFGERFDMNSPEKELHDCGIIYYPENPYLLCIMTKGKDFSELSSVIKKLSQMTYQFVEKRVL